MAIKSKLEPFDREIALIVREDLGPAARSRHLASFAKQQIDAASEINRRALGVVPPVEISVDERRGATLESVKPDGVIVAEFELIQTALEDIGRLLVIASPVRTGRYQGSHVLFADGVEVNPEDPPLNAKEYAFVNSQPYARKIEKGLSPQAPEGVYHVTAVLAARRYGNLAQIKFGFRSLPGGAVGRWSMTGTANALAQRVRGGNPARHGDWLTRQPSIIVRMR